jgi:hypothetical protein
LSEASHETSSNVARQSPWQLTATFASQEPLHDASHLASHVALGSVALHFPSHFALQLVWHFALQSAEAVPPLASAVQDESQSAEQEPEQFALQSKLAPCAVHFVEQSPLQLPVQDASAAT